jgi:hypothetical protein
MTGGVTLVSMEERPLDFSPGLRCRKRQSKLRLQYPVSEKSLQTPLGATDWELGTIALDPVDPEAGGSAADVAGVALDLLADDEPSGLAPPGGPV